MQKKSIFYKIQVLAFILLIMWIITILDTIALGGSLRSFGVIPRSIIGLRGIVCAPFLHAGFMHLISNTVPLFILGILTMTDDIAEFYSVFIISALFAGLGSWLIGAPNSIHIGASGVVFGLFGFLLMKGYFQKKFIPVIISITVAILYGGMIFGVLPGQRGISWQSHFFGFLGGVFCAWAMSNRMKRGY